MNISLRRGEARDLPFIYRLERRYIEDLEADQFERWQNSMERHLQQWLTDLPRTSIAEFGDNQAGYLFWEEENGKAVVASVNVEPQHRRNGVATMLLKKFEKEAGVAGFSVLKVGFVSHNPARELYGRLGYQTVATDGRYTIMNKHIQT